MTTFKFYAGEVDGNKLTLAVELRPTAGRIWGEVTNANGARVPGTVEVEGLELSICGEVYDATGQELGGGQCVDTLAAVIERGTLAPDLSREAGAWLLEVWRAWHLNGMKAGCAHQRAAGWDQRPIDPTKPTNAYGKHSPSQRSDSWNMLTWASPEDVPGGLMGVSCPECGYRYGTAWLFEPLPVDVETFIRGLARLPASAGAEGQSRAAATAAGVRFSVLGQVDRNPNMPGAEGDHWRVKLARGGRSMTLVFTKGHGHDGKRPTVHEVIECLRADASSVEGADGFEEWARDLGMSSDLRDAEKSYRHGTCRNCGRDGAEDRYSLGLYAMHACGACWRRSGYLDEAASSFDPLDAGESYDGDA